MDPLRFGQWRFDPTTGELWDQDHLVRLQDQPRQILALLASRPGQLVSRDEIRRTLWPDDTFVDFDTGINVAVNKLRLALRDSAATPAYIETLPRKGYRFLAPVVQPAAEAARTGVAVPVFAWPRKAVAATVAVLAIASVALVARLTAPIRPARPAIGAVAVLPFANLLGDPERHYFVDGMTDTLTTELASLERPSVISHQSARRYATASTPVPEIARALGVDAVVQGSVVPTSTGFAVNVQLVDGHTGRLLFADRVERADWGLVELPAPLLDGLARALGAPAGAAVRRSGGPDIAPEARNAYLRARFFWNRRTADGDRRAVEYLTMALRGEPKYALAWAALADIYAVGGDTPTWLISPWPADPADAGIVAAERALQLDPELGEAHAALGRLYMTRWRWEDALREARRGVELSPGYSTGRQWYGTLLARLGRCPEALVQVREGARLDPLTPLVNEAVGSVYLNCGRTDLAIELVRPLIEMHPDMASHLVRLANAYAYAGQHERAIDAYRRTLDLEPEVGSTKALLAYSLAATGRIEEARALVRELEQRERTSAHTLALAYAAIDDRERTFAALERAYDAREPQLATLIGQRRFWRFKDDPRYERLLDRLGLLPYWRSARLTLEF